MDANSSWNTGQIIGDSESNLLSIEFLYEDAALLSLYIVTIITSLFGNAIACYVCFVLRPKSTTYLLIGNMAASDLLVGAMIPIEWIFCTAYFLDRAESVCFSFKIIREVSVHVSSFSMALISYDRQVFNFIF